MKKLFLALTVSFLSYASFAQTDSTTRMNQNMKNHDMDNQHMNSAADHQSMDKMKKDCVMMKDGKMMVMKAGKTMAMDKTMKMPNGTQVMSDGTVMQKDGSKMMMKEGDCMDMSGKMMPMKDDMKMKK